MSNKLIVLCALLTGCLPTFETVEEACDGKVPGAKNASDEAVDALARVSCYRRLAKLTRARIEPRLQEASEAHNLYTRAQGTEEALASWNGFFTEEPGQPFFTGETVYDRAEAAGYPNATAGGLSVWQYEYLDGQEATDRIDFWFPDPDVRQSYLQLAWVGGAYAAGPSDHVSTTQMANMEIFYQIPVLDHAGVPVVYPVDGQRDVHLSYEPVDPNSFGYGLGELGYPITVTVGGTTHSGGDNPHQISVNQATLTGPEGDITLLTATPSEHPFLRYTVAFVPEVPLQANTEYTFFAELSWVDQPNRKVESIFTTGSDPSPHSFARIGANDLPRKPTIRHWVWDPAQP